MFEQPGASRNWVFALMYVFGIFAVVAATIALRLAIWLPRSISINAVVRKHITHQQQGDAS